MPFLVRAAILGVLGFYAVSAAHAQTHENLFAKVVVDGKKIGAVHYMVTRDEEGLISELKTRASLSFLGIKVYRFTQDIHEIWQKGELQRMWGNTDDDGTKNEVSVDRILGAYQAQVNGKVAEIPAEAFPASLWHYQVTQHDLLFDVADLKVMKVKIAESKDQVRIGKETRPADRFEFSGDWQAIVWFDDDENFLKAQYERQGRTVDIILEEE